MNKKQMNEQIATAQAQLAAARAIQVFFAENFTDMDNTSPEFGVIADAWNATHDMIGALEGVEHRIQQGHRFDLIVASGQEESYHLAAQNID
jgi:hypothetical protein